LGAYMLIYVCIKTKKIKLKKINGLLHQSASFLMDWINISNISNKVNSFFYRLPNELDKNGLG